MLHGHDHNLNRSNIVLDTIRARVGRRITVKSTLHGRVAVFRGRVPAFHRIANHINRTGL